MIPFSYLAFETPQYDSSTDPDAIVINDGITYALKSYAPVIAPMAESQIAGVMPYADVIDSITIDVLGSSVSTCTEALARLIARIESGDQWMRGYSNARPFASIASSYTGDLPLLIVAEVQGSTIGRVSAAVLGFATDEPPAQVSPEFDSSLQRWIIRDVTLTIRRRGAWYSATTEGFDDDFTPAVATPAVPGSLAQVTFSAPSEALTPVAIGLTLSPTVAVPANDVIPESVIAVGEGFETTAVDVPPINRVAAQTFLASGAYTVQADAANLPINGASVLRFNPATANPSTSGRATIPVIGIGDTDITLSVWATVRTNSVSSAVSFLVRPYATVRGATYTGRGVIIDASSTDTRVVSLGLLTVDMSGQGTTPTDLPIGVICEAIGGTGVTLDFDTVMLVNLSRRGAAIVIPQFTTNNAAPNTSVRLAIDPSDRFSTMADVPSLSIGGASGIFSRAPRAYQAVGISDVQSLPTYGDIPVMRNTQMVGYWLAVNPPYWVYVPVAARVPHNMVFARRRAYRTPR